MLLMVTSGRRWTQICIRHVDIRKWPGYTTKLRDIFDNGFVARRVDKE
jgi:hypothetical protein